MQRVLVLLAAVLALLGCGNAAPTGGDGGNQSETVIAAFKAAGLEAENPRAMTQEDYGDAPFVCSGVQFSLPSVGADKVGHVFICDQREQLTSLKTFYNVRGQGNPELRSWTYSKELVLVVLDGKLPRDTAKQYEAAIP